MHETVEVKPLVVRIRTVSRILDCSPTTVRRRLREDPDFPQPWRDSPEGDLQWLFREMEEYALRKAAGRHAALADHRACAPTGVVVDPLEQRPAARPVLDVKPAAPRSPVPHGTPGPGSAR